VSEPIPNLNDLARRLAAVEQRLEQESERLHMEAGLRAAVDSDLASLTVKVTATNRMVQAVAHTQVDHTKMLAAHAETLVGHTETLAEHGRMLHTLIGGQQAILGILNRLAPEAPEQE
jgi:hypothetical protein